jgi:hypothetical protein
VIVVLALVLGGCGAGPAGGLETRTFRLEHIEPVEMASLIEPYILSERGVLQVGTGSASALTVRERREILDRIGVTIAEYDRPRASVVLHFQVVEAYAADGSDPVLAEVEAVLRELFRFEGYRLAAEAVVRGSSGGDFRQVINSGQMGKSVPLTLGGRIVEVRGDDANRSVRLKLALDDPWYQLLATELEIPIGQTVVLGNGRPGTTQSTLILVVRPEIAE